MTQHSACIYSPDSSSSKRSQLHSEFNRFVLVIEELISTVSETKLEFHVYHVERYFILKEKSKGFVDLYIAEDLTSSIF